MLGNSSLHLAEGEIHKYLNLNKRDGVIQSFVKILDSNLCEVIGIYCFPTLLDI